MKCKRKKATFGVLAPNIQRGGMAIPLGNNLYWMKGRKHKTGGIDIGKDLEVENNEVMQMLPNETRVFSSVKMLGGNSPAELVASGVNPNMVFNAQEEYKRINRIKDDGSRYKRGGRKRADDGTSVETNNFARILYNNRYRNNKSTSLKMNNEEKVLTMANYVRPKNNYEYAVDGEDNYLFPFRKLANTAGLPSGLSNCTLTVSQLYNPARPINHARTITKNPRANGFYEVTPDYAIPGSMVIASNNLNDDDENNVYHTMVLTGFADKDYTYNFNGNSYKIKKGAPLVSYSRGGNNVGDWRTNIPLDVYMDNSDGRNFVRYYRPLDENGNPNILLDQLTVQPKKYGGKQMNLQNIDNPLARNNKRMISPNKLGTIVRVDGNGRDRLAYIPSTGSSKQDMKCGGRVKAETGLSWGYYPPRDGLLFGEDIDYNTGRDNTSYRVPLFASNDNRITGLRLPTLGYLRPSDTFLANWMTSANANNRDGVVNTQEPYGYVPRYSHLRLDTNSDNNNTSGSWSQFLTNLDTPTLIDKTDGANVYSTKKSDSVSPQSTNRKGISSYLDIVNDITKGESDWQGYAAAGVNALGSIVNSLIMNNALRKQRPPVRPVPKIAQKLKTKYNINPQLSENREATAQAVKDVVRNTASSQVGRNLVNSLGLQRAIADNKLFAEKENKETELINKDIVNRQSVDHENVDTYNKWLEARNDFYNNRSLLRAQNWASLVNGLGSAIGAGLGNIGASRRYRNNVLFAMLPYIKATGNG